VAAVTSTRVVIGRADRKEFRQCPYDGTEIEAEAWSGGSVLLACPHCDAAWEWHGAWIRRVREPERAAIAARETAVRPPQETDRRGAPTLLV
jgi:hypothetical protein